MSLHLQRVICWLRKGYDPAYGARPLKRVIQKSLQDPLAEELLAGRIKDGETVKIAEKAGLFTFNGHAVGGRKAAPVDTGTVH